MKTITKETLESLLDDCVESICKSVQREIEYLLKDEAIQEHCEANGYLFTETGSNSF